MTAALLALCALWPCEPRIHAAGGFYVLLPGGAVGATLPVHPRWRLQADYELIGAFVHDFGVGVQTSLGPRWDAGARVAHGFFGTEELGGADLADAPLGGGLTVALQSAGTVFTSGGVRVRLGGAVTARLFAPREDTGTVERSVDPMLHSVTPFVWASWPGGTFLQVRGLIPVQADLRVLGYLPMITVGRSWAL